MVSLCVLLSFRQECGELKALVHPIAADAHAFSHGECGEDCADAQPFQMSQTEKVSPAVTARQVTSKPILIFG